MPLNFVFSVLACLLCEARWYGGKGLVFKVIQAWVWFQAPYASEIWVFQSLCVFFSGMGGIISTSGEEMKACWIPMQAHFPLLCNASLLPWYFVSFSWMFYLPQFLSVFLDSTIDCCSPTLKHSLKIIFKFSWLFFKYHCLHLSLPGHWTMINSCGFFILTILIDIQCYFFSSQTLTIFSNSFLF